MSQSGTIVFYTEQVFSEPESILFQLCRWLSADWVFLANRTLEESQEWQRTLAASDNEHVSMYSPKEDICSRAPVSTLAGAYKSGLMLYVDLSSAPRVSEFYQQHEKLETAIRGNFMPSSPVIKIGHHDLFEEDGNGQLHYLARAFCSLSLWGYGTVVDTITYRALIWRQPFVQKFEEGMRQIFAPHPLKRACYWSF